MLNRNFLIGILAILLTFGFVGCDNGTGGGGDPAKPLIDGTWRRGNLDHYYQIRIDGSNWEYAEGAAGHILAYSNGTWVSSKDTITAGSTGIITLTTDQVYQNGKWQTYPETDYNLKTNAAAYTVSTDGSSLQIDEAILTTVGIWGTLEGNYEKQCDWGGWANANGDSTITLLDASGTFAMSGNIASGDDHWAGMGMFPTDTATQNAMKTAKSISFDVKGSGEYELILMTSDIQRYGEQTGDYTWYKRIFTAPATETTIKLNIEDFLQDGTYMEFKQDLWDGIQFAPVWNSKGPFNLTFGNVKVSDTADGMELSDWRWNSDSWGNAALTFSETDGTVNVSGQDSNTGDSGLWWSASPNNGKTSYALKNATTLSFKVQGDGGYAIYLVTRNGNDETSYVKTFTASGTEQTITLSVNDFEPTGSFDQSKMVRIQMHATGTNPFSLTISDLKLTGVRTPVTTWHGLKLPNTTKGVQYDIYDGKTDVLFISPNPKYDWHVLEYDLYEYRGKKLKIDFSVEMKLTENGIAEWKIAKEGNDGWNAVNSNSRQTLNAGTWYTVSGSYTMHDTLQEPYNFRLEGYNDEWPMLQNASAYIANFTITVTEVGADPVGTPVTTWKGLTAPAQTKALQYASYDGKSDVLHIEPNGTAYGSNILEYDLSAYNGKNVKIEFSADMKLVSPGTIAWQINEDDGHPLVAGQWDDYDANTWHTIHGIFTTSQTHELGTDRVLYLSQEQLGNVSAYITNLSITITEIPDDTIELVLNTNGQWGWQVQYRAATLLGGHTITTGDVFTFSYSFKSDAAIDNLTVYLVDNDNGWTELTNQEVVKSSIVAGTPYTGTVTLTAKATAKNATTMANKLVLEAGTGTTSQPTLTFTTLTLTKNGIPIPVEDDYTISGTGTFAYNSGTTRTVTVAPKADKSSGAITVHYAGSGSTSYPKSTIAPSAAGTYAVTFDVAAATGWNGASGLSAGTLTISPPTGTAVYSNWNGLTIQAGSATQYDSYDGRSDVLSISNYGTNDPLRYSLSAYSGKKVHIEVSMEMKLDSPGEIRWQTSEAGIPLVAGRFDIEYPSETWVTITGGRATDVLTTTSYLYLASDALNGVTAYIANFTITVTEIPANETWIVLSEDRQPNWQAIYRPATLLGGTRITSGDTFTLSFSFKSNIAIDELKVTFFDNGQNTGGPDNWGWVQLADWVEVQKPVAAGTVYTGTVTITATETAEDATAPANSLVFQTGAETPLPPTLQFTSLTVTKN